ncbi:MAG TPA: metallopeptidase family protein [Candidatus Saccharimonadia bacterium]|nr:metallopeptidase family protein [Candidatus Saccharimonadia bacterium]
MVQVSDDEFQKLINQALEELPGEHAKSIENVAILYEDLPTPEQRQQLQLRNDQTLLGLYEGTPLPQRQGVTRLLPDKITLFKLPLQFHANSPEGLKEQIKHTLWHEIAHYYGLNHDQIHELE